MDTSDRINDTYAPRSVRIAAFLAKYRNAGVFAGMDSQAGLPDRDTAETTSAPMAEQFVADLEAMGPAFVKIGQALSTRPDMVPMEYIAALERMQNDVKPIGSDEVRAQIERELGVRISKLFAEFDDAPLGSASLAQVHRAVLRDGREIAVKVQRPDVEIQILQDLDIISGLARTADRITSAGRRLHFADWVHEFRMTLLPELDYREEADNLERFAGHFRQYPRLFVPVPLRDLSARRVLTMTLVKGVKLPDIPGVRRTEQDMSPLAEDLLRGYLDQVFIHGDIHADPHPGNLLLADDGRLAVLDLSMVTHVPPRRRGQLLRFMLAATDGRGEEAADLVLAMGIALPDFDQTSFRREVARMISRYGAHGRDDTLSEGRMFFDMVRLSTDSGLRTPPEMSVLGKTLLNLESVSRALDPHLATKTIVKDHLQRIMVDRLRESFSPSALASEALEVQSLIRDMPGQVSKCLSLLAENRLSIRLAGLEESRLIENLQKIANRISAGVVTASLVLASAILMREERWAFGPTYSSLVIALFAGAGLIGAALVLSALITDRRAGRRRLDGDHGS